MKVAAKDDDRVTCDECKNLSGHQCLAAKAGKIVASKVYAPVVDLPRRCEGYLPSPKCQDKRTGRDRWPWLYRAARRHGGERVWKGKQGKHEPL